MRTFAAFLCIALGAACGAEERLNDHSVRLDSSGRLIAWTQPQEKAYDQVMRLAWNFLFDSVLTESNGLKTYYSYCCFDQENLKGGAWPHNPAGLYGMLADSAAAYWAYSGDHRVIDLVRNLLDYQLAHGTTPTGWKWGNMPYASSDHGATEYRGAFEFQYDKKLVGRGDGYGVIEPDKAAELGVGYIKFYELTGAPEYRNAAIAIATTLARNVREGDERRSPWPFRVYAETGFVREEYCANTAPALRLFDELIRLGLGNAEQFHIARKTALAWLLRWPMRNKLWVNYFEDIPFDRELTNLNQYSPLETARYLMDRPEADPDWRAHVPALLAWVEKTFGADARNEEGVQWGAITISEQTQYPLKMGSHTSRFASVLARWHEFSGDASAREKAYRSFNWATYLCRPNGVVNFGPGNRSIWYSDGYGDYIRHFMAGLGSVPEWAPPGENHLLRSSSIVTSVSYAADRVAYRTFDRDSTEVLRLAFAPARIAAGGRDLPRRTDLNQPGWTFDPATRVLRLRKAGAAEVEVTAK